MSAESNPNIYTPYSKSTAIWCSFWAFWTRLPTWFQFCSSHVGQSCLVLLGNLFIYPPAQSSLTSDSSHGAHEYIQEALCGHGRCLLKWHCSRLWVCLCWVCQAITRDSTEPRMGVVSMISTYWQVTFLPCKCSIPAQQHVAGQLRGMANGIGKSDLRSMSQKNDCDMVFHWCVLLNCICVLAQLYATELKLYLMQIFDFHI